MENSNDIDKNKTRSAYLYERFFSEIILDGAVQMMIVFFIVLLGILLIMLLPQKEEVLAITIFCCFFLSTFVCYLYQVTQLHSSQNTFGMRFFNLKLVDQWGKKPSLLKIVVRQFIYGLMSVIFALIFYYLMNVFYNNYLWVMRVGISLSISLSIALTYLITLFNKDRRTIHDLIVGTYVIHGQEDL